MPTISTRCPSCRQDIVFQADDCALLGDADGKPVAYAFVCSHCGEPVVRRADQRAVAMLVAAGASCRGATEQVVAVHPEQPASGPPLTADDLLDFHLLLEGACWFEQLAG